MEKKGNRNSPSTSKGSSGAELKKSQDVNTNKQFTRGGTRRREPPCGFSKPQTQRNGKTSDKRPKPRGSYYTGPLSRNAEACLAELAEPELGSIFLPGSKKQSLNHLLNFSLPPRDSFQLGHHQERNVSNKGGKLLTTRKHKYNKEHFLQANCQFIVNEKGDYRQYMHNPDSLVDWDLIEQVNVQVNEQSSCPICLYPPLASKMTKCGHIYCWTCILHYLALSDKEWRKCPICFEAVKKDDLKSVTAIPHKTFNINDTITFVLMKRKRGTLTAYPVDDEGPSENNLYMSDNKESCYSKLLLANTDKILEILDREKTELGFQLAEDENCPEKCFIEEASQLLEIRRNKVILGKEKHKYGDGQGVNLLQECDSGISSNSESQSLNSGCSGSEEIKNGGDSEFSLGESDVGAHVSKFHYFYQAADGQHIYLHAMNAKMLEHSYGSLEFGPKTIKGRILEKEGGSMTEELRRKLRYLQHLPVTCQFEVAEIRLHDSVVTKDTLEYFKEQIDLRKKRRQRREKEERKREKRIEMEENRKIGKYETPDLHIESRDQFPDVKDAHELFPDLSDNRQRTESESTFAYSDSSDLAELPSSLSNMSFESGFTSFASMLSTEKKRTKSAWPTLQTKSARQQSPPPKVINVTGQKMVDSVNRKPNKYDSDPEVDHDCEYQSPPSFNSSFGDVVAQALAKQVVHVSENDCNEPKLSGKKKKKNKGRILLSSMAFPGN